MKNNFCFLLLVLIFSLQSYAQTLDTVAVAIDSLEADDFPLVLPENSIQNPVAMSVFFQKLMQLEKLRSGKINIVHIGDSHIQADLMTNKVRKNLQKIFGNGGRGLIFPHNLAKTNGSWDIKFSSNTSWQNHKLVASGRDNAVGLSGIALTSYSKDFAIELNAKDTGNYFNLIKVITPKNENNFDVAIAKKAIFLESLVPKTIKHKIKKGEAISIIADKYGVSISELKKANGLKSNTIRAGKVLKIPTDEMQTKSVKRSEFVTLPTTLDDNFHFYKANQLLEKIYLLPNKNANKFSLNGVVIENDEAGIIYHNIGINGAKLSDYNKYALFFEQLKALQPDLIIVALGTNESFDKMNGSDFMTQLDVFLNNTKLQNPTSEILVITPPPSVFKRKYPNVFVADYAQRVINNTQGNNYAVWDMYSQLGGLYGVNRNFKQGLMANDKVHYSKAGYEKQGNLLSDAIFKMYQILQTKKSNKE